jgi:hypothetical protein
VLEKNVGGNRERKSQEEIARRKTGREGRERSQEESRKRKRWRKKVLEYKCESQREIAGGNSRRKSQE